jgi:hypothetical protein
MAARDYSFSISLHAYTNADEPTTSLQLWQSSGSSFATSVTAVVIGLILWKVVICKLLVLCVMAVVIPILMTAKFLPVAVSRIRCRWSTVHRSQIRY